MKKRNKKLPKYAFGAYKKPVASAAIQKDPNYISTDGDEVTWDNSQNQSKGLNAGQYAAIGASLADGGANLYSNLNNPDASLRQKSESLDNATIGVASAINPLVGGIIAGVNTIAKPIRTQAELTDENGNLVDRRKARNMSIVGGLLDPVKALSTRASYKGGFKDWSGQGYLDALEAEAKAKLPVAPPETFYKDNSQDAVWQRLNDYQQYGMGGQSNNPNAEVEGDELMRYPDGSTQLMNGPSHENGGIPVNIPQGTEIFSDRLKLPGSKQTIAEEAKKYATDKEDKILSNKKSTSIAKNTAKLSSQFKQQKLDELFNAQEQLKQAKVAKYAEKLGVSLPNSQFKMGGKKCYPNGGEYTTPDPYSNQVQIPMTPINNTINPVWNWNYNTPAIPQSTPITDNTKDYTDYNSMRNRNIAEGVGNGLLQNAGNFYDLYQTNMGKKYDIEDYGSVNPRYYNPKTISATESLRDADRQAAASRYALRNAVGGNTGAYLANLAANQTANTLNKAKIRESINNTNTNILNQADLTNTSIRNDAERYNLDLKYRAKVDTSMNKARSEDIARQAVRGIGENLSASYKDYKLGEQDQKKLALINQIFPNYKFNPNNFEFYYRSAKQANKPKKEKE